MSYDNVVVMPSKIHGMGLFCALDFEEGSSDFVHGILIPAASAGDHTFDWDDDNSFEPYPPYRFLNHSDTPNCEVAYDEEWSAMTIEALRDIEAGEELTIDYGSKWWEDEET